MCARRCDVTNTERSPQTLPQTQKPSRIDLILWCLLRCFVVCQIELRHIFLAKFLHHTVRVVTNKLVGGAAGVASAKGKNNATVWPLPQGRFLLAYSGDLTSTTDGTNARQTGTCALGARCCTLRSEPKWIGTTSKIMQGRQTAPRTSRKSATTARVPPWIFQSK